MYVSRHTRLYFKWIIVSLLSINLSGCLGISSAWTGAMMVYDRHNVYKKIDDYQLGARANRALFVDEKLRCEGCAIDLAVFHRVVLLTGHVPTRALREEANARVSQVPGIVKLYNQLAVGRAGDNTIQDSWITAKVRSQMMRDAEINPRAFKVVTADRIVYLMGNVMPYQGERVIRIARRTDGVIRVVNLLNYYQLRRPPSHSQ